MVNKNQFPFSFLLPSFLHFSPSAIRKRCFANCKLHDAFIDLNVHTHAPRANQIIIRQRKPTDYLQLQLQLQLRLRRSYLNLTAIPCLGDLLAHSFFSPFSLLIAFSNANNFRIWYETQCEAIAPRIISALWLFITYGANYSWIPGECRWRFVWMHSHTLQLRMWMHLCIFQHSNGVNCSTQTK